jgi:hypothetical protein
MSENDNEYDHWHSRDFEFSIIVHEGVLKDSDIKEKLIEYIITNLSENIETHNFQQYFVTYPPYDEEEPIGISMKDLVKNIKNHKFDVPEVIAKNTLKYTYSFTIHNSDEIEEDEND